jgi:carboxypeptidase Q
MLTAIVRPARVLEVLLITGALAVAVSGPAASAADDPAGPIDRLVVAMLGETPMIDDLTALTDRIGGRPTGSPANAAAVDWALTRFREAGVAARRDTFRMPALWLERSASATVAGSTVSFSPPVASMPYSAGTAAAGVSGPLVDGGFGTDADFTRLGPSVKNAFLVIETTELADIHGLFKEYADVYGIGVRASEAGAAGVIVMGSRPGGALYRHLAPAGTRGLRMLVMDRSGAARALRLLRAGTPLTVTVRIDAETGGPYESANVVGEIRGAARPDEVVIMGAHLDSWDLGTGALDNAANVALFIDVARQMTRLGLRPARTIRFALWNGEEQGIYGSLGYTVSHAAELDAHVMAGSVDIGCGRITGFFTGGRPDVASLMDRLLVPIAGLGPFAQVDVPVVGTDNLDFMLQGVPNLIANHEPAQYGPSYHARSDTLEQCDPRQLRINAAILAAVTWALANDDAVLPRHTREDIERLMDRTDLDDQLKIMGMWSDWLDGTRGRR